MKNKIINFLFFLFCILFVIAFSGLLLKLFSDALKYNSIDVEVEFNKCSVYLMETGTLTDLEIKNKYVKYEMTNKSDFLPGVTYTNKITGYSQREAKIIFTKTYCPKNA